MLVLRASRSWARVGAISQEQRLACDQADNRYIHRVANITIQARDHQMARGKWRSGRTQSLQREASERVEQHGQAQQNEKNTDHAKAVEVQERRLNFPAGNPPWHDAGNRPGRDDRKNCGNDDGRCSLHGLLRCAKSLRHSAYAEDIVAPCRKNLRPRATIDAVTASSRDACLPSHVLRTFAEESLMSSLTLLQSLHENLAGRAQVKSVFGDPVTAGEKTIIPVAKIAYGFGAGAGTGGMGDTKPKGEGGGGGGGVRAIPVGVFEVSARETKFVAIHDRKKTLATLLAGAALGLLFARRRRLR